MCCEICHCYEVCICISVFVIAHSNKLMCYIKKTISVKILVICVINSSRDRLRKSFVRGHIHDLFVSKALTRSYLARSGFDTNKLVNITPYKALSMT